MWPAVLAALVGVFAYPGAYVAVRGSGLVTHCAWWISQEGRCGGTVHSIEHACDGPGSPIDRLVDGFAPLVRLELAWHRRQRPPPPDPCS